MILVVILITSDAVEDILKTYGLGANYYVAKPIGLEEFNKIIHLIKDFWFCDVKLPSR